VNCFRSLLLIAALLPLSAQEKSAFEKNSKGWKNLMPKPNLKGWQRGAIPPTALLPKENQWKVENKVLVCAGDKGHEWLFHEKDYTDFVLHVEWRYIKKIEGNPRYNSGIFVRSPADYSEWFQIQIGDASGGYIFGVGKVDGVNKRFNLQKEMTAQRVKAAGEWNVTEVIAKGPSIKSWVNGAVVNEMKDCPRLSGRIGLEAEGFRIEFRKVLVKPLVQ
jgi:hypothetical protein